MPKSNEFCQRFVAQGLSTVLVRSPKVAKTTVFGPAVLAGGYCPPTYFIESVIRLADYRTRYTLLVVFCLMLTPEQLENALFRDHDSQEPKTVAVFDFDGTLASEADHSVYEVPFDRSVEEHLLRDLAKSLGLNYSGSGTGDTSYEREARYLRHVSHQTALDIARDDIEPGPALKIAKRIQQAGGEWYILTSRSSLSAVRRLFHFLCQHDLKPNQVFCVGRISKHLQIDHLLNLYPDSRIYFVDDLRIELDRVARNVAEPDRVNLCQVETEGVSAIWSSDDQMLSFYEEMRSKMENNKRFNEHALAHATTLYVYHAQQRLQGFRYFISATGLAVAAYAAALYQEAFVFSVGMALFGILTSVVFLLLDKRNEQLVMCDEKPMEEQQARLAALTSDLSFNIIEESNKLGRKTPLKTYGRILPGTFLLLGFGWVAALIASMWLSVPVPIE